VSFCNLVEEENALKLIVTVRNQGTAAAPASTTTVELLPGGLFELPTPAIPPGTSVDLAPLTIPLSSFCFNSDCEFRIKVDAKNQVPEINEENNTVDGTCIG
jgi:subtilase family serine protease